MDILEKFNRSFGSWFEGLFGSSDPTRPKEILRRVIATVEDNRRQGMNGQMYVPNLISINLTSSSLDEKEALDAFLHPGEIEQALLSYCKQNNYLFRGRLQVSVDSRVTDAAIEDESGVSIQISAKFSAASQPHPQQVAPQLEEMTVAANSMIEPGTVAAVNVPVLSVTSPEKPLASIPITQPVFQIGRSIRSGNTLVLDTDNQVSKQHALIERTMNGFTIRDLGSTNGITVNGEKVLSTRLQSGDVIEMGQTRMEFYHDAGGQTFNDPKLPGAFGGAAADIAEQSGSGPLPPARPLRPATSKLLLLNGDKVEREYILASENLLGRGPTCDVVINDRSVAMRHAKLFRSDAGFMLERLDDAAPTQIEGIPLLAHVPTLLRDGDDLRIGEVNMRYRQGD